MMLRTYMIHVHDDVFVSEKVSMDRGKCSAPLTFRDRSVAAAHLAWRKTRPETHDERETVVQVKVILPDCRASKAAR